MSGNNNATKRFSDTPQGTVDPYNNRTYLTNFTQDDATTGNNTNYDLTEALTLNTQEGTTYGNQSKLTLNTDDNTTEQTKGSGQDKRNVTHGGTDKTDTTRSGTDTTTTKNTGTDTRTIDRSGTDKAQNDVLRQLDGRRDMTGAGFKRMTPAEIMLLYRKTFLNIDQQLINEFDNLFMGVY